MFETYTPVTPENDGAGYSGAFVAGAAAVAALTGAALTGLAVCACRFIRAGRQQEQIQNDQGRQLPEEEQSAASSERLTVSRAHSSNIAGPSGTTDNQLQHAAAAAKQAAATQQAALPQSPTFRTARLSSPFDSDGPAGNQQTAPAVSSFRLKDLASGDTAPGEQAPSAPNASNGFNNCPVPASSQQGVQAPAVGNGGNNCPVPASSQQGVQAPATGVLVRGSGGRQGGVSSHPINLDDGVPPQPQPQFRGAQRDASAGRRGLPPASAGQVEPQPVEVLPPQGNQSAQERRQPVRVLPPQEEAPGGQRGALAGQGDATLLGEIITAAMAQNGTSVIVFNRTNFVFRNTGETSVGNENSDTWQQRQNQRDEGSGQYRNR